MRSAADVPTAAAWRAARHARPARRGLALALRRVVVLLGLAALALEGAGTPRSAGPSSGPGTGSAADAAAAAAAAREARAASEPGLLPALGGARFWMPVAEGTPRGLELIQRIEAAADKGNAEALAVLGREAADQGVDPWILVDDLCERGSLQAALSFVPHVVSQARELEEALVAQVSAPDRLALHTELWAAMREIAAGQLHSAARRLDREIGAEEVSTLTIRVLAARADVACALGDLDRGAALYQRVALDAEQLRWWRAARTALEGGGRAARDGGYVARAAALFGGLRRLQSAYGSLRDQAASTLELGRVEALRGDGPSATQLALEACRLAEGSGAHDLVGGGHSLVLQMCVERGAYAAALEARRLADAALTLGLADERLRAEHDLRVAALERVLGRPAEAEVAAARAVACLERDGDAAGLARALVAAARIEASQERWEAAGARLQAARRALDRLPGEVPGPLRADLRCAQAWLAWQRRRAEAVPGASATTASSAAVLRVALDGARAAQTAHEQAGMRGLALEARTVATLLAQELDGTPAVLAELEALRDEARVLGLVPLRVVVETAMVRHHVAAARSGAAMAQARSALEQVAVLARGLDESRRMALQAGFTELTDLAARAAASAHAHSGADTAMLWFEVLEARVATTLLHSLGATSLRGHLADDPELTARLAETTARRRSAHATLMARRSAADASEAAHAALESLERRFEAEVRAEQELQAELERRRNADGRAEELRPLQASLGELRARLVEHEAYVAYAAVGTELWALVVRRAGARVVRLSAGAAEQTLLAAAVASVSALDPATGRPDLAGPGAEAARELLRRVLLDGLRLDERVRRVCVCPDAELAFLPWAWIQSADRPLEVVLEPSATTLLWLGTQAWRPGRGVVALGDPSYPEAPPARAGWLHAGRAPAAQGALPTFRPLPYTRAEVEALAIRRGDVLLEGAAATEDGLWRALASRGPQHRWRSVHLAAHGHLDPDHPAMALLALTPSPGEDGLLTVAEILHRRVDADLVVLSACRTGRGAVRRGEGLIGLCRAFLVAGSPRVLASLWDVPDDVTAILMAAFYERLEAGADAAAALREAQVHVRGLHPDPLDWAGWVLWGLPSGPGPAGGPAR